MGTELNEQGFEKLESWLNKHWPGVENVRLSPDYNQPEGSGFSATTLIIPVSFKRDGQAGQDRIVVRLESDEECVYPQQTSFFDVEIALQYRAINTIALHSKVPVAPLIGYEADASVLGAPFFVMGFIEGVVPIETPIYTSEGFFVEAKPEQRRSMHESGLATLAHLHAIDWRSAGVRDWLVEATPGVTRQVELWERYTQRELGKRRHPVLEQAYDWIRANLPEDEELVLNWGDARPGNIIWQDFRCACVCDFENIAIGTRAMDLGWWLMFDRYAHEANHVERLPGEMTRKEQRAYYEACAGVSVGDTAFYELFAAVRYAALLVRIMNRWVARGDIDEDHTIWRDNLIIDMVLAIARENGIDAIRPLQ